MVAAYSALSRSIQLTWVSGAMGEGDRKASEEAQEKPLHSPLPEHDIRLSFVNTPRKSYHKFFNVFCNPLLWFLQHYMWNSPYAPNIDSAALDAWENGYMPVNKAFADAVCVETKKQNGTPIVIVQDYHLYLVGGYLRQELPHVISQHFTQLPWPTSSYWQLLPSPMRKAIFESLCANDIVGLQTHRDMRNFLQCCETFLDRAEVNYSNQTVTFRGRRTLVKTYPSSVDVVELRRLAASRRVAEYEKRLEPYLGEKTIVRVDRVEPSKNIVRGFRAFEMLLKESPELIGKVKFLAFLVPSRTYIGQYQRYTEEVNQIVDSINAHYGTPKWQPIKVFYENNYAQAIAGMRLYDVLLVNAVIDGMNMVAKEGPTVNSRCGVLIISETAGAHEQLAKGAITVSPADILGTTNALRQALTMSTEDRKERADFLARTVEKEDVVFWLRRQLEDLCVLAKT